MINDIKGLSLQEILNQSLQTIKIKLQKEGEKQEEMVFKQKRRSRLSKKMDALQLIQVTEEQEEEKIEIDLSGSIKEDELGEYIKMGFFQDKQFFYFDQSFIPFGMYYLEKELIVNSQSINKKKDKLQFKPAQM